MKFRVWDKTKKCWLDYDEIFIDQEGEVFLIEERNWAYQSLMHKENITDKVEVVQYTGLKDKNDKEIYEGDIVKTHNQNNVVKYEYGSFMIVGLHDDKYERNYSRFYDYLIDSTIPNEAGSRFDGVTTTLEVTGNIYENPSLLEDSK
ncbi:YopX family protein [Heyndrickxia camelliae]|nr:YopX family protein [Heyndrickxia camelliae]